MLMGAMTILCVLPLVVVVRAWARTRDIPERHHAHHDSYAISSTLLLCNVVVIIFMSSIGIFLTSLCMSGTCNADAAVVCCFFAAFVTTVFGLWIILSRYCVATYENEMHVTPFIGSTRVIPYSAITRMKWLEFGALTGQQSLRVWAQRVRTPAPEVASSTQLVACSVVIWGVLDIDQILLRINRFDVLS